MGYFNMFEVRWLCLVYSAKIKPKPGIIKLLYGFRTIRLYGETTIKKQGKLSSCYEKNISHNTNCRKAFVIGCLEKVLSSLGLPEVCSSV